MASLISRIWPERFAEHAEGQASRSLGDNTGRLLVVGHMNCLGDFDHGRILQVGARVVDTDYLETFQQPHDVRRTSRGDWLQ